MLHTFPKYLLSRSSVRTFEVYVDFAESVLCQTYPNRHRLTLGDSKITLPQAELAQPCDWVLANSRSKRGLGMHRPQIEIRDAFRFLYKSI